MEAAQRSSWKNHEMPMQRERLDFSRSFGDSESQRLRAGLTPEFMEDRWFIFFEDGWLRFHRSWTGHCIFSVPLEIVTDGMRAEEIWVNRDKAQYNSQGPEADIELLDSLIQNLLLNQ